MPKRRMLSVSLVILTALPWSLVLGVIGVWCIAEPHSGVFASRTISMSAGIAALCSAQIVFLLCIADRVFPMTHKVISKAMEGSLALIFLGSTGVLAVASIAGWGG